MGKIFCRGGNFQGKAIYLINMGFDYRAPGITFTKLKEFINQDENENFYLEKQMVKF